MVILSVDVGTTGMKMGIFHLEGDELVQAAQFARDYEVNVYNDGLFGDIEQEKWQDAFTAGCGEMAAHMPDVDVLSLSGTTPGLSAIDGDGAALYPAILMLDQRSRIQAKRINDTVGTETLLSETGNMPVTGGCSLASILWIRDKHPDLYRKTRVFGHSNTFMARWLTGHAAIDPSSASLTALYNTVRNDLSWNTGIAKTFDIDLGLLPPIIASHESPGRVMPSLARKLGLRKEPPVVIGGNDAVLAACSVGISEPGDTINVNGTCEISLVCLPRCISSRNYNVRAHVIPDRWLTLYVMNAGGKALEWFRGLFCGEMEADRFYGEFLPGAIDSWLGRENTVRYLPYLMGSRYSQEPLKAEFTGLTQESSREQLLAALVRGLCEYQRAHFEEIGAEVPLGPEICVTGRAAGPAMIRAKKLWMRDCDYRYEDQSSMRGAAMLGRKFLEG